VLRLKDFQTETGTNCELHIFGYKN
jgi:hypothetical protein